WCKVGLELFTVGGPRLVERLKEQGFHVFLDLKFYDIPNTVGNAVAAAANLGVDMLTLHCQGGERMCRAAVEARKGAADACSAPLLFGVTALTSFGAGEMPGIRESPDVFAQALALAAAAWGLDGVVCSGREVGAIKSGSPGLACLCPGIRPAGADAGDQRRTMTPAEAVRAGADYLVVGRPILKAPSPPEAAAAILEEMQAAAPGA
ncbi:MAG: orotidine-5'-phosphate decarboxylase, partial [Desulfovibrio sp.]|nr:orotidine-5'-phosphate decarboxylase [Desulfovibrio sp.]